MFIFTELIEYAWKKVISNLQVNYATITIGQKG